MSIVTLWNRNSTDIARQSLLTRAKDFKLARWDERKSTICSRISSGMVKRVRAMAELQVGRMILNLEALKLSTSDESGEVTDEVVGFTEYLNQH
jgi:hypothetical protein